MKNLTLDPLSPASFYIVFGSLNFTGVYIHTIIANSNRLYLPIFINLGLNQSDYNKAFSLFLLYTFSWFAGYQILPLVKRNLRFTKISPLARPLNLWVTILILILACAVYTSLFTFHPAKISISTGRSELTSGLYGKIFFLSISFLLSIYLLFISKALLILREYNFSNLRKIQRKISLSQSSLILLVLTSSALVAFSLIQLEGKSRALFPILSVAFIWHYNYKPIKARTFLIFFLVILSSAFAMDSLLFGATKVISNPIDLLFGLDSGGRTFDGLYNLAKVINLTETDHSFQYFYGETFIADILSDIGFNLESTSRSFLMQDVYGYPNTIKFSFPISKPAEFYINFGLIGTIAGGFILGALSYSVYVSLAREKVLSSLSIPVYIYLVMNLGIALPNGFLFQGVVFNFVNFMILSLLWIILEGGYRFKISKKSTMLN